MKPITIQKTVTAWQWNGEESGLPAGFHLCKPEIHYSQGRELVYFTYADMRPQHWISAKPLETAPEPSKGFNHSIKTERNDGTAYFRDVYPFAFYEIKSEASFLRDHSAKYLDRDNAVEVEAFLDFAVMEKWGISEDGSFELPPRLEYRVVDGGYGRGFKPYYMKITDWLVIDGDAIKVMSDEDFQAAQK